jgi:hypothetical protein
MTVEHRPQYFAPRHSSPPRGGTVRAWLREFAPHDWLVLGYLTMLNFVVALSASHPNKDISQARVLVLLGTYAVIAGTVRAKVFTNPFLAPFAYRLAAMFCVELTYFAFADLLPVVNSTSLDSQLYHLDMRLFGVEPAMFMDQFVTPLTTEWFSFFYFGYFFALAGHVLTILFLSRRTALLGHFSLGLLLVFCIGHSLYLVVPGYGPYKAMPEMFAHPFPPGVWWNMVADIVRESGAQKDIFPSLHTAAPTFMLLFSFHHRDQVPFRFTWPVMAFFTVNIVTATMFLRWHYVIDVIAGLLLAGTAHAVSVYVTRRECTRRETLGLSPLWPEWFTPVGESREREDALPVPGQ